jgi:alkylhydroperoxidase/carboxymuconolactone decarboxylase family protein YurZ
MWKTKVSTWELIAKAIPIALKLASVDFGRALMFHSTSDEIGIGQPNSLNLEFPSVFKGVINLYLRSLFFNFGHWMMKEQADRREQGWKWIDIVHGETGRAVLTELAETSPELVQYIVRFGYGEVYQQSDLDLPTRQLVIVSSLISISHAPKQLKVHMGAALNVGCTIGHLRALLDLVADFLPGTAIEGGWEQLRSLESGLPSGKNSEPFSIRQRHLIRLAAMFAASLEEDAVTNAVRLALKDGVTVQEIKSQILLMLLYAGFPAAMNAMAKLKAALPDTGNHPGR